MIGIYRPGSLILAFWLVISIFCIAYINQYHTLLTVTQLVRTVWQWVYKMLGGKCVPPLDLDFPGIQGLKV
ncbi:hypothetical protein [Nitrosomonas sp.]|uniref:hypothetical protein n=1 Tax=Nitrosomonas sp. TaxID=42353 RepID=UPI002B40258D|nr:hypothetical protein [Nitrosomonas sp.]